MQNDLVASTARLLGSVALSDYYGPPCTVDDAIASLLLDLADASPDVWKAVRQSLTAQSKRVLGRYALRASMVALRTENAECLYTGLLAHCLIRGEILDWRDDLVFFAPYVHTAQLLGEDVTALFDRAAFYAVPELATVMRQFARRTDITLGAFGWRQTDTPDGPTFESLSWKSGPSGAVIGEKSWDEVNRAQVEEILKWARKRSLKRPPKRKQ